MARTKSFGGPSPRPAHETKDIPILSYPFLSKTFQLKQLNDGQSNGTGLWLGSQCLSLYLADIEAKLLKKRRKGAGRMRAIELGSGVGLGSLALASSGWDVLATDVGLIIKTVLTPNVLSNPKGQEGWGRIQARELDWSVPPSEWSWSDSTSITNPASSSPSPASPPPSPDKTLSPPFDLILTSDTIFSPTLTPHLLRTIHHLSLLSSSPPVYVAIENRDPLLVSKTLQDAQEVWGFNVTRIPHAMVSAALKKGGVDWEEEEWEGVEVWKLVLRQE